MCHMELSSTRRHRSFRFSEETLRRLDARAHEVRETRTALAERYVEEGLRMEEHPGIGFADGPTGRRAVLLGTGLDAWEVIATLKANAGSAKATAEYLDLPIGMVRAAVRYYGTFPEEIDAVLDRQAALARREQEAAQRERAILG